MKQIFYIIIALSFVFASCQNEEKLLFEKSAQQRIKEKKELCLKTLLSSEKGWKVQINPAREDIGVYNFLVKFNADKKAIMADDVDIWQFGTSIKDSAYFDVKYTDDVEIVFETFSRFNYFYNPEVKLNDEDNPNKSLGGDIELLVKEITTDKIICEGKAKKGTYVLTKITADEDINLITLSEKFRLNELNFAFLIVDDESYLPIIEFDNGDRVQLTYNYQNRAGTIDYWEEGKAVTKEIKVTFDSKGVIFSEPIAFNEHNLTRLDYDSEANAFGNASEKANLIFSTIPVKKTIGLAQLFNNIKFGPVTGKSKKAKTLFRALQAQNDRFTTLQMYNDPNLFHGWAFKFSDKSEWPFVKFKDNKIEIFDEDKIRFTPDGVYNDPKGTIDLNEVLKTPEGKAIYDILFAPEGFVLIRQVGARIVSLKDPDFWLLVSNGD